MNKSLLTNLIALSVVVAGYLLPQPLLFSAGIFALSGAVTNWLAVHMLFERVPLLYGSGVIPNRFEEFKTGIKQLIIQEFFAREHIERFFSDNVDLSSDSIKQRIDFDRIFAELTDAIAESSFGGMLSMVGGKQALEPLKEPVIRKLEGVLDELLQSKADETSEGGDLVATLTEKVESIIDKRLQELTPEKVKEIVQDMIRKHLGWLVVWGGVFGGLIGVVVTLLPELQ